MRKRNRLLLMVLAFFVFSAFVMPSPVFANSPPSAEPRNLSPSEAIMIMTMISIPGIVLTIISESLVSLCFGFNFKARNIVRLVNLISQVVMRVLFVFINIWTKNYLVSITTVELLVYLGEYITYRKIFGDISSKKLLALTVVANTVSLLLGLWMNDWLLFVMFSGG